MGLDHERATFRYSGRDFRLTMSMEKSFREFWLRLIACHESLSPLHRCRRSDARETLRLLCSVR